MTVVAAGRKKLVLVSGGCGFLGSHLIDRLLERRDVAQLVCLDNLWTGRVRNVEHVTDPRFRMIIGDVEEFRAESPFDEIYHFASPASPPWYMTEPGRTISANVVGAMRLLEALRDGGKFCFASTSEVYGDPAVSPQPESYRGAVDCTGPRASYDEAKRVTEALLFETRRTRGLDLRVVRLFNTYGPRMRPDDGRAVANFIAQGLSGQAITVQGDGSHSRSWGYVDDVIEGLARYFWRDPVNDPGPVNIGNDREIPVIEVARFVASLLGAPIEHVAPMPQDPTNRCPDLARAGEIIPGWTCRVPYEDGVRLTIDWFRQEMAALESDRLAAAPVA